MGYTDNYKSVKNRFGRYLTRKQAAKLLDKSKSFSRQNAFNRVAAANTLRTGFQQGFNGLRNVGMQNSGEVERLKKKLAGDFTYTNDQLKKAERENVYALGRKLANSTRNAQNAAAQEAALKQKLLVPGGRRRLRVTR